MTASEVTVREPNQTAPGLPAAPEGEGHAPRPPAGTRARLTQEPVTARVRILWAALVSYWLDEQVLRAWQQDRAGQKRYAQAPPWCADNAGIRFLSKVWYPIGVVSTTRHHLSAWVMRRPGRFATVCVLVFLLWAVWPAPVSVWVPVIAIAWLV